MRPSTTVDWDFELCDGDMPLSISQIAAQIVSQTNSLDPVRRKSFLEWLVAHSSRVGCGGRSSALSVPKVSKDRAEITAANQKEDYFENHLKGALMIWFESLPAAGVLWEYRLVLSELAWWRALDGQLLSIFVDLTGRA